MIAIAGLLIAITSPLLGAIADHEGRRKPWIAAFSFLSIFSGILLWFAKPSPSDVLWTLWWVGLSIIGVEVSMVFYNAMLSDLAPKNYVGRISGWGWGLGYFGGLASLIIALFVFVQGNTHWLGLDQATFEPIRITGPFVSAWFAIFTIPLFLWTPDRLSTGVGYRRALHFGTQQILRTMRELPKNKEIFKFLLAHMIYIDGLNTIFAFGGIYAAGTFGMSFSEVIQFGITLNVAAGVGAIGFAWMDDYVGSKETILVTLGVLLSSGVGMLMVHSKLAFWILGMLLSLCVGPVQAASRSWLTRAAPPALVTECFGLYALSGKATAFIGPWLVGLFTLWFDSQRIGMSCVMVFLLVGGIILCFVKSPQ